MYFEMAGIPASADYCTKDCKDPLATPGPKKNHIESLKKAQQQTDEDDDLEDVDHVDVEPPLEKKYLLPPSEFNAQSVKDRHGHRQGLARGSRQGLGRGSRQGLDRGHRQGLDRGHHRVRRQVRPDYRGAPLPKVVGLLDRRAPVEFRTIGFVSVDISDFAIVSTGSTGRNAHAY
jgi:hypothetical protein